MSKHTPEPGRVRAIVEAGIALLSVMQRCPQSRTGAGGQTVCENMGATRINSVPFLEVASFSAALRTEGLWDAGEIQADADHADKCVNALRGLDVAKAESLLDAVRAFAAASPKNVVDCRSQWATDDALQALADSIRAGGGPC